MINKLNNISYGTEEFRCFVTLILPILFFLALYDLDYVHAANQTDGPQNNLLSGIGLSWLQTIFAVVSIALTIIFYFHQQTKQRKEAIKRSCGSIIKEIDENKKLLESKEYEKIEYNLNSKLRPNKIKYTNAYLDSEAYKSVLHSGFFTFFSTNTQNKLALLYGRIQSRNELISYVDHFQDIYFLHHDDSESDLEKWYKKVERYDILLAKWEEEILVLLDEVKGLVKEEQPR